MVFFQSFWYSSFHYCDSSFLIFLEQNTQYFYIAQIIFKAKTALKF